MCNASAIAGDVPRLYSRIDFDQLIHKDPLVPQIKKYSLNVGNNFNDQDT